MPAKITFTVQKGGASGKTFTYESKESLIIGRQDDCSIVLPESTVSRYHCLIDIAPPSVVVRDFGSLNGTYLNGEKIGQREAGVSAEEVCAGETRGAEFPMKRGDMLGLGKDCELGLDIKLPQYCADCLCEIEGSVFTDPEGPLICSACHEKREKEQIEARQAKEAAERAKQEREEAQKKAEEMAAKEKAAEDAKAKAEAEKARREAEAKAAELKRKEEEQKRREQELEEKRQAEQAYKEAEQKKRDNPHCGICGKTLPGGAPGICDACQKDPVKIFMFLLNQAENGQGEAKEIAGYSKIKMLGEGGMGQVWLVEEQKTGRRMALKLMLPRAAADEKSRELFQREAYTACQLNHKNVVKHEKFGQSGDTYFILLEFCDGGSADNLINKSGGKLSIDLATKITLQVLDGLAYAHNAVLTVKLRKGNTVTAYGVVHRDFKPGNIFLTGSGNNLTAKVADFGLAKAFETAGLSGHTSTGQVSGTPVFMPRQQIINCKYAKPDVDVWAAAASYYYMLTGAFPKDFTKGKDVFAVALSSSAVPIRKRNAAVPKKLAEVIDRALTEKPAIGVQSAAELKKLIEGAL